MFQTKRKNFVSEFDHAATNHEISKIWSSKNTKIPRSTVKYSNIVKWIYFWRFGGIQRFSKIPLLCSSIFIWNVRRHQLFCAHPKYLKITKPFSKNEVPHIPRKYKILISTFYICKNHILIQTKLGFLYLNSFGWEILRYWSCITKCPRCVFSTVLQTNASTQLLCEQRPSFQVAEFSLGGSSGNHQVGLHVYSACSCEIWASWAASKASSNSDIAKQTKAMLESLQLFQTSQRCLSEYSAPETGIGGGGGHGTLEGPGDLAVGYRRWGGPWDAGGTWGFGCRV